MGQKTLFVAAGHGGTDCGNTAAGIVERDELIAIVRDMRAWFKQRALPNALGGYIITPDELDLKGELAYLAPWKLSRADGDLAVDVHLDYRPNSSGALVLHNGGSAKTFADRFLPAWCRAAGIRNNGVHYGPDVAMAWRGWPNFGFLAVDYPAVIIELGCLNDPQDMEKVRRPIVRHLLAELIWEYHRSF